MVELPDGQRASRPPKSVSTQTGSSRRTPASTRGCPLIPKASLRPDDLIPMSGMVGSSSAAETANGGFPRRDWIGYPELGRLEALEGQASLRWRQYENEVPGRRINNIWAAPMSPTDKRYVVQTATKAIQRCVLMTTDPGDLVFDPTCGSGTTAWVAEQWGRRWITCDTSRVAVTIARQRLMTANYDYYELAPPRRRCRRRVSVPERRHRVGTDPGVRRATCRDHALRPAQGRPQESTRHRSVHRGGGARANGQAAGRD